MSYITHNGSSFYPEKGDIVKGRNATWLCIVNTPVYNKYLCIESDVHYGASKGQISTGDFLSALSLKDWKIIGKMNPETALTLYGVKE